MAIKTSMKCVFLGGKLSNWYWIIFLVLRMTCYCMPSIFTLFPKKLYIPDSLFHAFSHIVIFHVTFVTLTNTHDSFYGTSNIDSRVWDFYSHYYTLHVSSVTNIWFHSIECFSLCFMHTDIAISNRYTAPTVSRFD